mmetsp:Transcript_54/g.68  ORF Transcript_54/g.68 Transcript_54/m.68 type:complete len:87 (+) Transcript_54:3126-3386(+)
MIALESPVSQVRVARAAVANVTVPKSIAVAIVDNGAASAADNRPSIIFLFGSHAQNYDAAILAIQRNAFITKAILCCHTEDRIQVL